MTLKTSEQAYDVGVIVGRFQVDALHPMHCELIETVIAKHHRVIIFLGVSQIPGTEENPLSFHSRRQMLLAAYPKLEIHDVYDHWSDDIWSQRLDNAIAAILYPSQTVVLYGSRDSFLKSYHGTYDTRELLSETSESGSDIRRSIANGTTIDERSFRAGAIWSASNRFPSVHPTVDAAILSPDGSKVLLGKKARETLFRFIGGFIDVADETFERAVGREVREETGLILNQSLFSYIGSASIDDWRYRGVQNQKIMTLFFLCHAGWGDVPIASDDITSVEWVAIDTLTEDQINPAHRNLLSLFLKAVRPS